MLVVSDTTPIISLLKINRLGLLQSLYGQAIVPAAVFDELTRNKRFEQEAEVVRGSSFIVSREVANSSAVEELCRTARLNLGESEAIVLFGELGAELLLIDEWRGRAVAEDRGLAITGTMGVLLDAYEERLLSANEVQFDVGVLKSSGRYYSDNLYTELLAEIEKQEAVKRNDGFRIATGSDTKP
ncbi:MAG: hypothetical protein IJ125_03205 [Atopobiaceae bacterium]|nr:hypothetical protein [Atopobiaceae bacterium]